MLATTDSDGLPGHASGCLQFILLMLMVGVEVGLVAQGVWLREVPYIMSESGSRVERVACRDRGWPWLAWMCWPGVLLVIQVVIAPAIWRSRRNYKEGVIFSLGSLACTMVTAAWVTVYIVCAGKVHLVFPCIRFYQLNIYNWVIYFVTENFCMLSQSENQIQ